MNIESTIDEKGRVCIPVELRKRMNIKLGEKIFLQIKGNTIIMRKSTSVEEFIKKSKEFSEHLKKIADKPIEFKKIFE